MTRSGWRLVSAPVVARAATLLWVAVLGAVTACVPSGPARDAEWVPFTSEEGGFRALFPVAPTHKTSADGREHRYTAQYARGSRLLRASYELDYDTSVSLEDRFAAVGRSADVQGPVNPAAVTIDGNAGMEATYKMVSGSTTATMRHCIFHVGTTSYQLLAVMTERGQDADADAEAERFFGSFELLTP